MSFLIIMVLLLVVMYVLMIRPQRQRQRQQQAMIEGAKVGDDVLTTGGIYGTVTRAEGDDVVVEIANGLEVHMTRRGIAAVLPPEADDEPEVVDAEVLEASASGEADASDETDEVGVTDGEEPVTSEAGADAASGDRR
ncbi:MAG TPA: preprotein translocase subunit YajC [Gaiellaceae bacterium]|nr:preprotein translocase subunit YajC [Gaiellaceae bacterium]